MAQQLMRSEKELCPTNVRFHPNNINVRINPDELQDEPLSDVSLEILKNNTFYNALTLTTKVHVIYMQQFWDTVIKNKQNSKYFFVLDHQRFRIRTDLIHNALQISPRQPNIHLQSNLRIFLSILNKSLTGKASGIDRVREPIVQILWGVVTSANVDFALLLWEHFRFQINKHKNLATKYETIPYLRFTKLVIRHLLSHNPNLNKHLDSTPYFIGDEARLEKLKYVAKGERKPTFGMPIPEAMISKEIKESQAYVNYLNNTQHDLFGFFYSKYMVYGKRFDEKSEHFLLSKKKDVYATTFKIPITVADNLLQKIQRSS
ncbi:hypothetical protein Tco_1563435 [Tanacetum coccineum]